MFTRSTPAGSSPRPRRPRPRLLAAALSAASVALSVALAGCGAAGDDAGAGSADKGVAAPGAARQEAGNEAGSVREDAAAEPGGKEASADKAAPDPAATHVVRTASLTVTVGDVPGALARARAAVEAAGGHVADETTDRDSGGRERSRVTLRVPPEEYEEVLEELSGLGKLVERKVSAKDVTDRVVDAESRIRTQRASVERVRELMDEATKLSDVVALEAELSTRQADLESLQARLASLEGRTRMATVTLALHEPDGEPARDGGDDGPTVGDALAAGWDAFTATLHWIVVVLGAVLPFAAAAGLAALLWRVARRRLPRGAARPSRTAPAAPEGAAGSGTGGAGGD